MITDSETARDKLQYFRKEKSRLTMSISLGILSWHPTEYLCKPMIQVYSASYLFIDNFLFIYLFAIMTLRYKTIQKDTKKDREQNKTKKYIYNCGT